MKRTLSEQFLDMLNALDLGKWRLVRYLQGRPRSCCVIANPSRASDIIGPEKLVDQVPSQVVDAVFREINNPTPPASG
jgi:hypothetical protein